MPQTKKILVKSLQYILKTKPLDKITITQLVEECGINRQTFYYHFHDIYELVEYMFLLELENILKNITEDDVKTNYNLWEKTYYIILCHLLDNKVITMNIFHSIGKQRLEDVFNDISYDIIMKFVEQEVDKTKVSEEEKRFIGNFYKHAFVGITLDWIKNFMHVEPKIMIKRVNYLVEGNVKKALNKHHEITNNKI